MTMTLLEDIVSSEQELPEELQKDVERYLNQGGLLGLFTYFLLYLETGDSGLAETAASIPTSLFVMSSLHDDAIDEANEHEATLKEFLNIRTTLGDQIFTHVLDFADELPEQFNIKLITRQFRKIGAGQLREEELGSADFSALKAIERVEERGSVWGELAVSPVEAGGYYTEAQLNHVYTFCANLLFVLTVVDDVEDIPEDLGNDVMNVPLLLYGEELSEHRSEQSLIEGFLNSDVPQQLDDICTDREQDIEKAARGFDEDTEHSREAMIAAWNRALKWYQNTVCTISVDRNVSPERQEEIHSGLISGDEAQRQYLLEKLVTDFPARFASTNDFIASLSSISGTQLAPAVVIMTHIEMMVESVMTTNLEDAFEQLQAQSIAN